MSVPGSVSILINQLKTGDPGAAQQLWERYFRRMVGLARTRLQSVPRRAADEEDAALCAFDTFCRRIQAGQFPQLADRDNLWHLLVTITSRKAMYLARAERQQKRGEGRVVCETDLRPESDPGLEDFISREPTAEHAAQVADEYRHLLNKLTDDLRIVALWKMEGYTNEEIAGKLGHGLRSVARSLCLIREIWSRENS
jgi:DNA-directed RNA polymerase specialized sigma24 family protein